MCEQKKTQHNYHSLISCGFKKRMKTFSPLSHSLICIIPRLIRISSTFHSRKAILRRVLFILKSTSSTSSPSSWSQLNVVPDRNIHCEYYCDSNYCFSDASSSLLWHSLVHLFLLHAAAPSCVRFHCGSIRVGVFSSHTPSWKKFLNSGALSSSTAAG